MQKNVLQQCILLLQISFFLQAPKKIPAKAMSPNARNYKGNGLVSRGQGLHYEEQD